MTDNRVKLTVANVALASFNKYNAHLDYSDRDLLLKLVTSGGYNKPFKEGIFSILGSFVGMLNEGETNTNIISFLDLLLVRNSVFITKYIEWLMKLAELNFKAYELEQIMELGKKPNLHVGMMIHTATADTERKMKDQYGGAGWKRITNFPILVVDGFNSEGKQKWVGKRGGESFVTLVLNNILNHSHELQRKDPDLGDVWKINSSGNNGFLLSLLPGLDFDSKQVFPEVSTLNWNNDNAYNTKPLSGSARYVKPHFNVPPYKDVYIWECTELEQPKARDIVFGEEDLSELNITEPVPWSDLTTRATPDSDPEWFDNMNMGRLQVSQANLEKLAGLTELDLWSVLVSDELMQPEERYESKDATIRDVADLASWYVWCNTLHIERRYLFRDVFRYLIEDIQDRIYLLLKRITDAMPDGGIVKERLVKGQYVFMKDIPAGVTEDEIFDTYYKMPKNAVKIKIDRVFLRGTPMFTDETRQLYDMYCDGTNGDSLKVEGGLGTVNLYSENFPKHLHWSSVLNGMNSINVKQLKNDPSGGKGTDITMNDPRTGGLKYGNSCGTGPYHFESKNFGSKTAVNHNNMPKYITMSVYLIV